MGQLDGKVALVTGGARGQGRAHAVALAREGAAIAVCDVPATMGSVRYQLGDEAAMAETIRLVEAEGSKGLAIPVDVRDSQQVDKAVAQTAHELGPVDILVANAGICTANPVGDIDDTMWTEMIDTNLSGVFWPIRAVLAGMVDRGYGRIVATSSMAGRGGTPNLVHYAASKWGVIGLVKSVALEVAGTGVTANVLCPTTVHTDMVMHDANYRLFCPDVESPTLEDTMPRFARMNPLDVPWLEPDAVARELLHLVTDPGTTTGLAVEISLGASAKGL